MHADGKMISFLCKEEPGGRPRSWEGTMRILKAGDPCEAEVEARGSYFHLIVGKHSYGNFVCIPNWNVGTELSGLDDIFWNTQRLRDYTSMKNVDACSVAAALNQLAVCAREQTAAVGRGTGRKEGGE